MFIRYYNNIKLVFIMIHSSWRRHTSWMASIGMHLQYCSKFVRINLKYFARKTGAKKYDFAAVHTRDLLRQHGLA